MITDEFKRLRFEEKLDAIMDLLNDISAALEDRAWHQTWYDFEDVTSDKKEGNDATPTP